MNLENEHNKQQPFGVPSGYFESFQDTLDARMAEERLREHVKDHGFAVPQGYFDNFKVSIQKEAGKGDGKVISLFSKQTIITVAAIAARILLVLSIFKNNPKQQDFALEDISTYTLETYLESDAVAFTNDELTAYLDDEVLNISVDSFDGEITNDELENYFLENLESTDLYIQYEE